MLPVVVYLDSLARGGCRRYRFTAGCFTTVNYSNATGNDKVYFDKVYLLKLICYSSLCILDRLNNCQQVDRLSYMIDVLSIYFPILDRVGHGSLFQNPTQPKISEPNPTHKSQPDPTQAPTHHRHLVWHIRLYRKLYTTTVTRHRQVHSR